MVVRALPTAFAGRGGCTLGVEAVAWPAFVRGHPVRRVVRHDPAVDAEVEGGDELFAERVCDRARLVRGCGGIEWAWVGGRAT